MSERHVCTECGMPGATLRRYDCGDVEHWFHVDCWRTFCRWLADKAATPAGTAGGHGGGHG